MNFQEITETPVPAKEVTVNGMTFNVKQYLPIEDKYSLINAALQNAEDGGVYNPVLLDMFFHSCIVFMYTDIEVDPKGITEVASVFDTLCTSGILDAVIANIPTAEYDYLNRSLKELTETRMKYNTTVSALIQDFINDFPRQATAFAESLKNFDEEKLNSLIHLATTFSGKGIDEPEK